MRACRANVWRKLLVVLLVLTVIGGLLFHAGGSTGLSGFRWPSFWDSIRNAHHGLLILALVAMYATYAIRALRWLRFSRHLGQLDFFGIYASTLIGFTTLFVLGRVGEPIRPLLIARRERTSVSAMFGIYVLERLFDAASAVVLFGVSLLMFPHLVLTEHNAEAWLGVVRTTGAVMLFSLMAAVVFLLYFRLRGASALDRRLDAWRGRLGWHARAAGLFKRFSQGLQGIRSFGDLAEAIAYSAAHWILVAFIYLWIAWSFGGDLAQLDFPSALLVLAFTLLGSTIQLPGVGGGSQVASFLAFTLFLGVDKEAAAAAAITLWLITFAGCSVAGVPLMIREGWSMGKLRRLARAKNEGEAKGSHLVEPARADRPGAEAP